MSGNPNLQVPDAAERAKMSREELGALGMALDGVELAEYGERYVPGSPADKRAERQVAKWFLLAGAVRGRCSSSRSSGGRASGCRRTPTASWCTRSTRPIIGATLGADHPVLRHRRRRAGEEGSCRTRSRSSSGTSGMSDPVDRQTLAAQVLDTGDKAGIKRRGMLKGSLLLAGGGLGRRGDRSGARRLHQEPLGRARRLAAVGDAVGARRRRHQGADGADRRHPGPPGGSRGRLDGHGVPGGPRRRQGLRRRGHALPGAVRFGRSGSGTASRASSSATTTPTPRSARTSVARSRCTNSRPAGCCARATSRSSISTKACSRSSARPPGPLPQLPIELDDEGYFVAAKDFIEAVGPGFWENGKFPAWYSEPKEATG